MNTLKIAFDLLKEIAAKTTFNDTAFQVKMDPSETRFYLTPDMARRTWAYSHNAAVFYHMADVVRICQALPGVQYWIEGTIIKDDLGNDCPSFSVNIYTL